VPFVAVAAGLAASGLVVARSSSSACSTTTVDPTSSWAAGTVALSDDDTSTAASTATGLRPGSTGTRCIVVSSIDDLPASVKRYGTSAATTRALSSAIDLAVAQGTGGSSGSCTGYTLLLTSGSGVYTGTLADFAANATSFTPWEAQNG